MTARVTAAELDAFETTYVRGDGATRIRRLIAEVRALTKERDEALARGSYQLGSICMRREKEQRARADLAEARLKVAVEALRARTEWGEGANECGPYGWIPEVLARIEAMK